MKRFFLLYCVIAPLIWAGPLLAQATDATATVQFSNGQTLVVSDFSEPIGVMPNASIRVTVAIPGTVAGETVNVASLDGGHVAAKTQTVSADGTISFQFQPTADFGLNRLVLRHATGKLRLQFWVLDPANPQNNPPVITATTLQG